jgi:hypothetical protein
MSRVSSTYRTIGKSPSPTSRGGFSSPLSLRSLTMYYNGSAPRTKRRGERGSLYLTPLLHLNFLPRTPLTNTEEVPVSSIIFTQKMNFSGNPMALKTSFIASCSIESKAFSKSSLRIIVGFLDALHWWIYSKDQAMQSWIVLPLMKPY